MIRFLALHDRRLWLGDLRLQALASHATVQADAVLRRCLYLFAALPRSDGMVNGCVQERPSPRPGQVMVLDYAALFAVTLQEYVQATGDLETGVTLWPVARRQVELLLARLDGDALFHDDGATWCFIDWSQTLDRDTAMQGVILFAIDRSLRLAAQHYLRQLAVEPACRFDVVAIDNGCIEWLPGAFDGG